MSVMGFRDVWSVGLAFAVSGFSNQVERECTTASVPLHSLRLKFKLVTYGFTFYIQGRKNLYTSPSGVL